MAECHCHCGKPLRKLKGGGYLCNTHGIVAPRPIIRELSFYDLQAQMGWTDATLLELVASFLAREEVPSDLMEDLHRVAEEEFQN